MHRFPGGGSNYWILLAMADHAHDDGTHVFPSMQTLADKARISKRQAQRVTQILVGDGWIKKSGKKNVTTHGCTHWVIDIERLERSSVYGKKGGDNMTPLRDDNMTQKGDVLSGGGDTAMSPEPSLSTSSLSKGGELPVSRQIPPDFSVTDEHREYAKFHQLPNPDDLVLEFVAHYESTIKLSNNWDAMFRKWMAKENGFQKARPDNSGGNHGTHRRNNSPGVDLISEDLDTIMPDA